MTEDIHAAVQAALQELTDILAVDDSKVTGIGCFDPKLEDKWQWECPGGAYMLLYERLSEYTGDPLYHFMRIMRDRGVTTGQFYVHLQCLYLYEVRGCRDLAAQEKASVELRDIVAVYNEALNVDWQVIVEEGGSAPITE